MNFGDASVGNTFAMGCVRLVLSLCSLRRIGKKGYAGGLAVSAADRKHIGPLGAGDCADDVGVSFTVLAGLHQATWHRQD